MQSIQYKHKETGFTISRESLKAKLEVQDYVIELAIKEQPTCYDPRNYLTEVPVRIFRYDIKEIPFSDDFELVTEGVKLDIEEMQLILRIRPNFYTHTDDIALRELQNKCYHAYNQVKMNERGN